MLIYVILLIILLIYINNKSIEKMSDDSHETNASHINYGLKVIDELFNKNDIYYTIAYGTLLGAVRHWGMIPWDDDADINVLKKDFNKIVSLKDEFKKRGLILEVEWKLIKIYFNEEKFPFIDIFINDVEDGKIIRCREDFNKCKQMPKDAKWWWKWLNYPAKWILERKRFKFNNLELWGPKYAEKVLKFWYGEKCLVECFTASLDHITGDVLEAKKIGCSKLPKPQL